MQENLKFKYGISDDDFKRAVDQIPLGKIACEGITLVALTDLLCNGDIKGSGKTLTLTDTEIAVIEMALTHLICDDLEEIEISPDSERYTRDRIKRARALNKRLGEL